ncbi:MAG: helix-turn-helix transcriptional regulator [Caldilineaceae bacterium]|nr:helix-turn-helix transcriptional regulator [Caldilineaceae bacterium]
MIEQRLSNLMGEYQRKTGERLTYRDLAEAAGVSKTSVATFANGDSKRISLDVLDALLIYFSAQLERTLTIDELLQFRPE